MTSTIATLTGSKRHADKTCLNRATAFDRLRGESTWRSRKLGRNRNWRTQISQLGAGRRMYDCSNCGPRRLRLDLVHVPAAIWLPVRK